MEACNPSRVPAAKPFSDASATCKPTTSGGVANSATRGIRANPPKTPEQATAAESRESGERPPVQGLLCERVLCPLLSGALRIACGPGDAERLDPGDAALGDL